MPALIARPARAAREVTIVGVGGWFQSAFDTRVLGAFRKTHPDVAVFFYPLGNAYQVLGLLRGQAAAPNSDIALVEAGVAARATTEGLFVPLDTATMPVIKNLIPQAVMPGIAGPAVMIDSLALGYNPAKVTRPPQTWRNLWDPSFGPRIALQTPPDPAALALTAVAGGLFGGGGPAQSLGAGLTALTQLAPRVVLWDPAPDVASAIAAGDADIGPGWNAQSQNQAAQTPARLAAAVPADGSPVVATTINLVKGAPQAAAARTLIAWLLGPEAQKLLADALYFAPVNPNADISAASLARAGAAPAQVAHRKVINWEAADAIRGQIAAAWRARNLGNP
ncbi:MAG TPA: extracellular solute-binding protein [Rhodopila sp.]|jgi:putative spermidine/putrescine transport system substrate-binding protein|nr:extracellular solute-binding protein [Rhodopila sp.]